MNTTIVIEQLKDFSYVPSKKLCEMLAEAAAICLDYHQHAQNIELKIEGDLSGILALKWDNTNQQIQRSWDDLSEATEYGATCLAIWIIEKMTNLKVIGRSQKKTGIDFWLGNKDDEFPFRKAARLEISGILQSKRGKINQRLKEKGIQSNKSDDSNLPAYIIVIEFSQPIGKTLIK